MGGGYNSINFNNFFSTAFLCFFTVYCREEKKIFKGLLKDAFSKDALALKVIWEHDEYVIGEFYDTETNQNLERCIQDSEEVKKLMWDPMGMYLQT